jgi:hypothetical protein
MVNGSSGTHVLHLEGRAHIGTRAAKRSQVDDHGVATSHGAFYRLADGDALRRQGQRRIRGVFFIGGIDARAFRADRSRPWPGGLGGLGGLREHLQRHLRDGPDAGAVEIATQRQQAEAAGTARQARVARIMAAGWGEQALSLAIVVTEGLATASERYALS